MPIRESDAKIAIAVPIKFELAINLKVRRRSAWPYRRGLSRVSCHLRATQAAVISRLVSPPILLQFGVCCRNIHRQNQIEKAGFSALLVLVRL
jgi:hypothetical protein